MCWLARQEVLRLQELTSADTYRIIVWNRPVNILQKKKKKKPFSKQRRFAAIECSPFFFEEENLPIRFNLLKDDLGLA